MSSIRADKTLPAVAATLPRRFLATFLLFLLSLLFALALMEAALRLLGHHGAPQSVLSNMYEVDDPVLDWRYTPNSETRIGPIQVKYNSAGFRDVEQSANRDMRLRLVVLGDSVTEGYGVEWASVFASVVRSALEPNAQVVNLSMQGLNTPQEVHLLEQSGLGYAPNLVVVNFILNDCDFFTSLKAARRVIADRDSTVGLLNVPINPQLKQFLKSSALVYFAKDRIEYFKGWLSGAEHTDYFTRIWQSQRNRQMVSEAFDRLQVLASANSFEVVVVVWPLLTDYSTYARFQPIHAWVSSQSEVRGFATLDLLGPFASVPYRELQVTPEDNVHPNARGHKLAADAFLTWLRSRSTTDTPLSGVSAAGGSTRK